MHELCGGAMACQAVPFHCWSTSVCGGTAGGDRVACPEVASALKKRGRMVSTC